MKNFKILAIIGILAAAGCEKSDPTIPVINTAAATEITTTTATAGGEITSNGGAEITERGICFSKTNSMPTVADSKAVSSATTEAFSIELSALETSSTYYFRAYAINSVGAGYGEVMSFMTGNAAPEARNVKITGNKTIGATLTAGYTYFDVENNPEGAAAFTWYIANDTIGSTVSAISGATGNTYTVATTDKDKFIKVGVTPVATAGTTPGTEAKSFWFGPIGGEVVTFTYMGQSVTYGVIVSALTGRKWLDRNLGAKQAATSFFDYLAYGDLFQWGRPADGHQLIMRNGSTSADATPVNGTTTTLSTSDTPTDALFIINPSSAPYDWRTPKNNNLWQGVDGPNNVCPSGWRIPTSAEWKAEGIVNADLLDEDKLLALKLVVAGYRRYTSGNISYAGPEGIAYYWTSDVVSTTVDPQQRFVNSYTFNHVSSYGIYGGQSDYASPRSQGNSVRCIKD
jgi:uncharacterized protein (TIGR02145 family)